MATHVYISIAGEDKILRYILNIESGVLQPQGEVVVDGGPAPLAVDWKNECVYVGLRGDNKIGTFHVDPRSGDLSLAGKTSLDADPCYLFVDRTGKFLLSTYYGAGKAQVHALGESGVAIETPVSVQETEEHAHWIQTDRSNRYVFVPHTMPPNGVYQFIFDSDTGSLTPNAPAKVAAEDGPRHIDFHPHLDVVYTSNEDGSTISAYRFDTSIGTLEAFQTLPTLPDGYEEDNTTAQIHIHPSGQFIYVSNRGHNSIAGFGIDEQTGELTSLGQTPTEPTPRVFNLDPTGSFLYAAGQGSGKLASYRIDQETGALDALEVKEIGERPMWVMFIELS